MSSKKQTKKDKKVKKNIPVGIIHIKTSFNNTIINFTDEQGNTIVQKSAGNAGFRGSRKSNLFAAQQVAKSVAEIATKIYGAKSVEVRFNGIGLGRDTVLVFKEAGLFVSCFKEATPVPHNGCRPRKRPRG
ncbi:30S ribosomal protein S11 ['Crotalaria aegyptiaca' phytoplasma]|uniref:Small ribosomal subunit protein uS11 n=1 Tax=Candidatus Phytoplasma crotalariae TaxID=2982627 RepID=A0ABT9D285_9MOLU|nr:30S ribosomal protein S11 ['Crotalaria aegyptiaca' phytoplasma]MDO8059141.1 30S ribosomal protein S11 ['Crotalaria aegyptiaca' phytoplasma]